MGGVPRTWHSVPRTWNVLQGVTGTHEIYENMEYSPGHGLFLGTRPGPCVLGTSLCSGDIIVLREHPRVAGTSTHVPGTYIHTISGNTARFRNTLRTCSWEPHARRSLQFILVAWICYGNGSRCSENMDMFSGHHHALRTPPRGWEPMHLFLGHISK